MLTGRATFSNTKLGSGEKGLELGEDLPPVGLVAIIIIFVIADQDIIEALFQIVRQICA